MLFEFKTTDFDLDIANEVVVPAFNKYPYNALAFLRYLKMYMKISPHRITFSGSAPLIAQYKGYSIEIDQSPQHEDKIIAHLRVDKIPQHNDIIEEGIPRELMTSFLKRESIFYRTLEVLTKRPLKGRPQLEVQHGDSTSG